MFLNVNPNSFSENSFHKNSYHKSSNKNINNNNKINENNEVKSKIKNISNDNLIDEFIMVERTRENKVEHTQEKKKKFTPLGTPGKGLNLLGKICSITTTAFLTISDQLTENKNSMFNDPSTNLLKEGSMLTTLDVQNYISALIENFEKPFHFIPDFLTEQNAINKNSLEEIINSDSMKNLLAKGNDSNPIVIPMIIAKNEAFGRNHVVIVIIKNNTVRYFDAKGKYSQYVPIEKNKTIRDVLEFFKENFTNNGKIVENPVLLQLDSNNCGVYICRDMYSQIINDNPVDEFSDEEPSLEDLKSFRLHMLEQHESVNQKYLLKQWEQQRRS
ncbi:MAG: hypothetical protein Q8K60_02115 [Parachlamydiaceae bacterium]|nr:hypothetical protein [Parachlamydiaceae bacterium]